MSETALGRDAYTGDRANTGELFKNLEGCPIHDFAIGTGEHRHTALAVVELPTGEGLGVQVTADSTEEVIPVYQAEETTSGWRVEPQPENVSVDELVADCPLEIIEAVQKDIMTDPRVTLIVAIDGDPHGIDIYVDNAGGTEFYSVEI